MPVRKVWTGQMPAPDEDDRDGRVHGWPLRLPTALGVLVALAYLPGANRSLDFDSSQTVGSYIRTASVADAISSQRLFNNHPAFSLIEHLVYTATGSSEDWVLRVAPIAFAALAVAVLVSAVQRRIGTLPALGAGLLVATNPTVIAVSRAVRGYSLLLLCGIVSSVALAELLSRRDGGRHSQRLVMVYVGAVAVGMATHLYMVPIVMGHVAVVVARRRLDADWVVRWMAGLGLGGAIYAAMAPDLVAAARTGSRTFKPGFPLRLGEVVLGSGWAALLVGGVVLAGALPLVLRRPDLRAPLLVVGGAIAFTWLGTASVHLEPRFHVWLVPAAAAAAAVGVAHHRVLFVVLLAGAALNAWSVVGNYTDDPHAQRDLAALLDRAASRGERGCVTSYSVLPTLAYTHRFEIVRKPADLAACDLVVVPFPSLDKSLEAAARVRMAVEGTYSASVEGGVAFARDPDYFTRMCREAPADLCPD